MRVPLDDHAGRRPVRAGLTLAPTMHVRSAGGVSRMRIGEGFELGLAGDGPLTLTPVHRLGAAQDEPETEEEEEGGGLSTLGWIAIGVGGLLVVTAAAGALAVDTSSTANAGKAATANRPQSSIVT